MKLYQYFEQTNQNFLSRYNVENLRLSAKLYYWNCQFFGTEFLESDDHFAEMLIDGNWYTIGFYYSADNTDMIADRKSRIRIHDLFINDSDGGCDVVNVDCADLIGELIAMINHFRNSKLSS